MYTTEKLVVIYEYYQIDCLHKEDLCILTLNPIDFIYQESADLCKYAPSGERRRSSFGRKSME